jgi:hypothetical protein
MVERASLRHRPASRVSASSLLLMTKLRDARVRDKPRGAQLHWRRRRLRIRVAGKGAERGIFVRIDLAYIYLLYRKGRVNPSPRVGGWDIL